MNEFLSIIKAQFTRQFLSKTKKRGRWVRYLVLLAAMSPIIAFMSFEMFFIGRAGAAHGVLPEVFSVLYIGSQLVIVFVGTIALINRVYFSTDVEMLSALPIKPHTIFLAKFFYVYIDEFLVGVLLGLATFIPFGIGAGATFLFFAAIPLMLLLMPLLPLLVAAVFSVPLMFFVSFMRRRAAFSSVIYILVFGAALTIYILLTSDSFAFGSNNVPIENLNDIISEIVLGMAPSGARIYPNYVLGLAFFAGSAGEFFLNFALGCGILFALLVLAGVLSALCYSRGAANMETAARRKRHAEEIKEGKNLTVTLMKKDWAGMIKNPGVAFLCLTQIILLPALAVFVGVSFAPVLKSGDLGVEIDPIFITLGLQTAQILLGGALNQVSATAISRENTNLYLMKCLPVPYKTQIEAKAFLGSAVTAATLIVSNIIIVFLLPVDVFYTLLSLIFLIIAAHALSYKAVSFDLLKPSLNWQTANEGLKNNSASIKGLGYGALCVLAASAVQGVFYLLYAVTGWYDIFVFLFIALIALAVMFVNLFKKSLLKTLDERMEKIEV